MSAALIAALFFTVILLVVTACFLMGSVPLLILKHDTPMDGNFVRGFFDIYYRVAMCAAGAMVDLSSSAWADGAVGILPSRFPHPSKKSETPCA